MTRTKDITDADINGDGSITITDVTKLVNSIIESGDGGNGDTP